MFSNLRWSLGALLFLWSVTSNAALFSRVGGQAYYDTVLDITWLADANLAATNTFGIFSGINPDGSMSWAKANEWIAAMNFTSHLGVNDWRLPNIVDTGTPGCDLAYTGTDCGHNVDLSTSEMAHLYYSTLGNVGYYDTSGSTTGCAGGPNYCLTNTGPFSNVQPYTYWSGTTYAPDTSQAWVFNFDQGSQDFQSKSNSDIYAWAVRSGDIAAVPVPAVAWLFGLALGLAGLVRGRPRTAAAA